MPRSNAAVSRHRDVEPATTAPASSAIVLVTVHANRSLRTRLIAALREWRRRVRSRRQLAGLSQLELKDLGYPAGSEAEKFKPFWRA